MLRHRVKKLLIVLVCTSALIFAVGCSPSEEIEISVPWRSGEVSVLQLTQHGEAVGTITLEADLVDGYWRLVSRTEVPEFTEEVHIHCDARTLTPSVVEYSVKAGGTEVTYTATYGDDSVDIGALRAGEKSDHQVKLPTGSYFDNEQFTMLLRALPLAEGFRSSLDLIVTRSATKAQVEVEVVGRELLDTGVGTIEAWKVELKGAGQFGWVEIESPHRLLGYENVGAATMSVLREYDPGQ